MVGRTRGGAGVERGNGKEGEKGKLGGIASRLLGGIDAPDAEHGSVITRGRQEARPHQTRSARPPPWLLVPRSIRFKLCLLMCKVLHRFTPSYLADLCRPVMSVGSRQRQ